MFCDTNAGKHMSSRRTALIRPDRSMFGAAFGCTGRRRTKCPRKKLFTGGCSENPQNSVGKKAEQKGRSSKEGLRETEYKRNLRQRDGEPQFLKGFDVSLFYLFCINSIEIIGAKINEMLLVQKDMVNRKNQTVSNGDYRSFSSAPCGNFGIFRKEITVFVSNR